MERVIEAPERTIVYVGGTHRHYNDYCREQGLDPAKHVHLTDATGARPLNGLRWEQIKVVRGIPNTLSIQGRLDIDVRLRVMKEAAPQ